MALKRRTKSYAKIAAIAIAAVFGWDLYKAHTNGPAPTVSASRIK